MLESRFSFELVGKLIDEFIKFPIILLFPKDSAMYSSATSFDFHPPCLLFPSWLLYQRALLRRYGGSYGPCTSQRQANRGIRRFFLVCWRIYFSLSLAWYTCRFGNSQKSDQWMFFRGEEIDTLLRI